MEGEQQQGSGEQQEQGAEKMVTISQAELDRKFNKTRKNAQAETEARIRREYAARGGQQQEQQQQRQSAQPAELKEPERPKRDAFPDYEAYLEAREKYLDEKAKYEGTLAARAERERMQQEDNERKVGEARASRDREFSKHAKAIIAEHPEIADAIENADDVQMSAVMGDAIKEAGEVGVYVLHYLVEHPEEAERIAALPSESAQTRAIGKIEAKVEAELEAKKKAKKDEGEEEEQEEKQSERRDEEQGERSGDGRFKAQDKGRKAPEPIEPGTGRSANLDRGPNDKDSDKSWFEKRLAQERAERERRTRK